MTKKPPFVKKSQFRFKTLSSQTSVGFGSNNSSSSMRRDANAQATTVCVASIYTLVFKYLGVQIVQ